MSSSSPVAATITNRNHRVDVLRGVSIAVVLILHFHLAYDLIRSPVAAIVPRGLLLPLARNGNYGVTVFFVISGYLITSTSMRRFGDLRRMSPSSFYLFRFARIAPNLLLMLLIVTALGLAGIPYFTNSKHVSFALADLSVLTFWHNVLMAKFGYFNYCLNILWSLSVEEVFYLAFPLLWIGLRKTPLVVAVWIAAIAGAPVYRSYHQGNDIEYLYAYLSCFDAIAAGCCAALASRRYTIGRGTSAVLQACGAAVMIWVYFGWEISQNLIFGPSFMAAGAAVFLLAEGARTDGTAGEPRLGGMAWFGGHSYELYLFHIIILAGMRNLFAKGQLSPFLKLLWFAAFLLLSAAAAWAIARFYAEPWNRRIRNAALPD